MSELRAIVFSDLHLKNYTRFAEWDERGLTTRAYDCLSIIDAVFDEAKDCGIDTVFFTGDLFHDRSKIDVSLFNETYKKFLLYEDSGIDVFMISGNHDQVSKSENENSIQLFDNIKNVHILNGEVITHKGFDIVGLQATDNKDFLHDTAIRVELKNPAILLTHSQITNSVLSNGIKMLNGLPVDELSKKYVAVICGDIHQFQIINKNIIIPGSPIQHHFGDKGSEKYILDVSFKEKSVDVETISIDNPKFFSITLEDVETINDDFNFYIVNSNKVLSVDQVDKIREKIKYVDFVYDIKYEVDDSAVDLNKIKNKDSLLESYIETIETDYDKEEILNLAKTFL